MVRTIGGGLLANTWAYTAIISCDKDRECSHSPPLGIKIHLLASYLGPRKRTLTV